MGTKSRCSLSSIHKHMKEAVTQLFKRQSKNHAFFKIIELLLCPLGKLPGKTKERKPDPWGN